MHGLVFSELKKFVDHRLGPAAWNELLASAGLGNKFYMATQEYPDTEVVALVTAASHKTKIPANDLLEAFGEFITPSLLRMFGHLAKPSWRTLEFIENAEEAIHSVVRINNPGAKPPRLHVTRYSFRAGSGGKGKHRGGDGIVREIEVLTESEVNLLADRRKRGPYGLSGGSAGKTGSTKIIRRNGKPETLAGKAGARLQRGDRVRIESPGGGGYGRR